MSEYVRKQLRMHLSRDQRRLVRRVLVDHNYHTWAAAGREMARRGHYETASSAKSYLHHVLDGGQPVSHKLARALLELCGYDERLSFLNPEGVRSSKEEGERVKERKSPIEGVVEQLIGKVDLNKDGVWIAVLCSYFKRIYEGVMPRKVRKRLLVIGDLDDLVEKHNL